MWGWSFTAWSNSACGLLNTTKGTTSSAAFEYRLEVLSFSTNERKDFLGVLSRFGSVLVLHNIAILKVDFAAEILHLDEQAGFIGDNNDIHFP